jgi:non-specific protein-tyrosine kinase
LLGLSIGLVVALLVVAVREAVDTTVRSESDVEDLLAAPVLASVRSLPRRTRMVTFGRHSATFGDTYALLAAHVAQLRGGKERLALAVTSSVSGEGKTTTAGNLAVALARRGIDVLLADFDSRKPSVGKLFRIPPDAGGVLQVLDGSKQLDDVLWSVDLGGPQPRISQNGRRPAASEAAASATEGSLVVLPSGGSVRTQAVAHSPNLPALLEDLRERADVVVIDTPPALLTVEMAELSRVIDCVLVVVRQGHVTQRSLRTLGRQTRSWPAELIGAVVTDVPGEDQYAYYGAR